MVPVARKKTGTVFKAVVNDTNPSNGGKSYAVEVTGANYNHFLGKKIGDVVDGKVSKVTSYGAFVELEHGIDGLVHISQISEDRVEKVKDVLQHGQDVSARVIKIDRDERRIGLSVKAAHYDSEQLAAEAAAYDSIGRDELTSLGDILDEATK